MLRMVDDNGVLVAEEELSSSVRQCDDADISFDFLRQPVPGQYTHIDDVSDTHTH